MTPIEELAFKKLELAPVWPSNDDIRSFRKTQNYRVLNSQFRTIGALSSSSPVGPMMKHRRIAALSNASAERVSSLSQLGGRREFGAFRMWEASYFLGSSSTAPVLSLEDFADYAATLQVRLERRGVSGLTGLPRKLAVAALYNRAFVETEIGFRAEKLALEVAQRELPGAVLGLSSDREDRVNGLDFVGVDAEGRPLGLQVKPESFCRRAGQNYGLAADQQKTLSQNFDWELETGGKVFYVLHREGIPSTGVVPIADIQHRLSGEIAPVLRKGAK